MSRSREHTDWRPGASRLAIEGRAALLADIRAFFAHRRVLEVETPILSRYGNADPNIDSITAGGLGKRYLRTSPEYAMKRLLAAGQRDIYELGRVFRAGEKGHRHNPEFTMLEWYRSGMGYLELADEVVELVRSCGRGAFDDWPIIRVDYRRLFIQRTGLDPYLCSEDELSACADERGILAGAMEHGEWLDLLISEVIQPALPGESFTVVHDYPPEQAALSRIRHGDPPVAERFEVFLGQIELANGYQELTDADEQRSRFERENREREARGEEIVRIDDGLIEALRSGLPDCSGVALGVDRLLMAILKLDDIDAVLTFSADRI
jgi:lysyl-tRNA synthetase class 2